MVPNYLKKLFPITSIFFAGSLNKSDRVEEVKLEYHNLLPVDTTKDATGQQSELKSEIIQTNHMDIQIKNEIPTPKKKKKKKK